MITTLVTRAVHGVIKVNNNSMIGMAKCIFEEQI